MCAVGITSSVSFLVTALSKFKCLMLTPIWVPSQANIFGSCPQNGSICFLKSILKADSQPKNQEINVLSDINGYASL